jgi:uncharacterized protein (TIGR02246 family)
MQEVFFIFYLINLKFRKMKTHGIFLFLIGFSLFPAITGNSQNPDEKQIGDIDGIKQTAVKFDAAYNRRDAVAFSKFFLKDADFQWHTGEVLKDRKQIEQYFTNAFKSMPPDYKHITTFQRIRFLGPDIAIGDGTLVITQAKDKETNIPVFDVLFTCVGKKVSGQWKLAAIRLILPKKE